MQLLHLEQRRQPQQQQQQIVGIKQKQINEIETTEIKDIDEKKDLSSVSLKTKKEKLLTT